MAILGLDSAGKTTTTKAFLAEPLETAPTLGFNKEEFSHENFDIVLFDLGGGRKIRDIWKNYLGEVYGIIYVLDSSCRERIPEVKENLEKLLENDLVKGKPVLVLANKQDLPSAMDEVDLIEQLNLEKVVNDNKCPCKMEMCSAIKGTGKKMDPRLRDGLNWLCSITQQCYDKLSLRIKEDMEIIGKRRAEEQAAKRERVRIMREERERKEAEEKKRLGIEEDENQEEEEDDIVEGGPFRRVDDKFREDISKKEALEKAKKKKQKDMDRMKLPDITSAAVGNNNTNSDQLDDDIPFRTPRSSRSLMSYGLANGTPPGQDNDILSGEDDNGTVLSRLPASRKRLPPLQVPPSSKFTDDRQDILKGRNFNNNNKTKHRYFDNDSDNDDNDSDQRHAQKFSSVSRIEVASLEGPSSEEENVKQTGTRRSYQLSPLEPVEVPAGGRKKKGKKKKSKTSEEDEGSGFDTLRLSQHLEDDVDGNGLDAPGYGKPPSKISALKSLDGEDYTPEDRALTPVKKLKKKKKKHLVRKNKLAPSDDEFELSDVHDSPKKQQLPWDHTSPRAFENHPDINVPASKWSLTEDLQEIKHSPRRPRPNIESEDDLML